MKKKVLITVFLIVLIVMLSKIIIDAYNYPLVTFTSSHPINATLGEYRSTGSSDHFHNGIDIGGADGTKVYSIYTGTAFRLYPDTNVNACVQVTSSGSRLAYVHLDDRIDDDPNGDGKPEGVHVIQNKTVIGKIRSGQGHVHLTENSGSSNPLRSGGISPYSDTVSPSVHTIEFYRQGTSTKIQSPLNGDVDILSKASDAQSLGSQTVGVYKIGYQIKNVLNKVMLSPVYNIQFDSVPSSLSLVYDTSRSNSSNYYYWVTNEMNSNTCWNTKQSNSSGSSTDNPAEAKYPDGEYTVMVIAKDIKNNTGEKSQQVILNNWTPQIKSLTINATPDKPLKAGDTVEIKIEFTEQMDTGKTPTVQIWDAKESQWKSLSLSGTAWSNSSDGRIKDALLKASAKLPDWGETG